MANTLSLNRKIILPHGTIFEFLCTLSGNYTSSGKVIGTPGETLNFNGASNPNYLSRPRIPNGSSSGKLPATADCKCLNDVDGYTMIVEQNATSPTAANFVGRILTSGDTELGAGAYSAALKAEPFILQVYVSKKSYL